MDRIYLQWLRFERIRHVGVWPRRNDNSHMERRDLVPALCEWWGKFRTLDHGASRDRPHPPKLRQAIPLEKPASFLGTYRLGRFGLARASKKIVAQRCGLNAAD